MAVRHWVLQVEFYKVVGGGRLGGGGLQERRREKDAVNAMTHKRTEWGVRKVSIMRGCVKDIASC